MKEKHPIDELFSKGVEEHEIQPSAKVWDSISSEVQPVAKKSTGWLALRAASVSLIIGLSGWLYFTGDFQQSTNKSTNVPVIKEQPNSKPVVDYEPQDKTFKTADAEEAGHLSTATTGRLVAANNKLPVIENESELESGYPLFEDTKLKIEEPAKRQKVKIKLNYNTASTAEQLYENEQQQEEGQHEIGEKLWAFASNQFNNIVSGAPVEMPKRKSKPQLEINLDKIFNR